MFSNNLVVTVGETSTTYGLLSVEKQDSKRANAAAALGCPDILTIAHERKGSGATAIDRHLIRLDQTFQQTNADGTVASATGSVYVVLVAPQKIVTAANMQSIYAKLAAFMGGTESGSSSTNLARLLNGEP